MSMEILLLEPFLGGSHRQWAEGYAAQSRHAIQVMGLPARHWKWRMHGAAVTLARQFLESGLRPDCILASDMLDLTTFLALTRAATAGIPTALYFHENQLAYPWSPGDADPALQRDHHYSFINYCSALAADAVYFNSRYNHDSFLDGLPAYLGQYPDFQERNSLVELRKKSRVLPLGLDLQGLDAYRVEKDETQPPLILWNHRWEHDKGPEEFFAGLMQLSREGIAFRLAVLGAQYKQSPRCFAEASEALQAHIVHWGYADSRAEYARWLWQADFLPVTARQDFFGGSVVEAMYCGVRPLLPARLAYPEHVPAIYQDAVLYVGNEWIGRLRSLCLNRGERLPTQDWVAGYDWSALCPRYDASFEELIRKKNRP